MLNLLSIALQGKKGHFSEFAVQCTMPELLKPDVVPFVRWICTLLLGGAGLTGRVV